LAFAAVAGACAAQAVEDPARAAGRGAAVTEVVAGDPPGPLAAKSFRQAREDGRARIIFFYVPSSGFAYRDREGNLTGVTVELLRDFASSVADTHGIQVEVAWVEEPRWADFYGYVRDSEGGVFGIGNVTITEARRAELDFSPPYLNNIAVLVTNEQVPELASMEEIGEAFAGLTALPYPGTLHEARLNAIRERWLPGIPIRPVASNDELVSRLASEAGYFGYIDVYNYWRARQAGQPLRRHPVGDDSSETFGVILPHGSDWTPVLREFFQAEGGYARSARFQELLRRHLGDELASLLSGG
jgi:putative glutamine transport system substrate-binding protein